MRGDSNGSDRFQSHSDTSNRSLTALRTMLAWDVRLQIRYGFYAVYAILTAVFVLGLQMLGPEIRTSAAVLLIVTDPTLLGFYFIAAMVLFEKREGVLDALVVSPLGKRGYLVSKVLTLSLLAVLAATLVAVVGHGSTSRLPVLIVGVALSASMFVLIGFVAVARFDSINEYFLSAVGWGTILFLPLFGYVGIIETRLFYLLPAQPTLVLVTGGFRPLAAWEMLYGISYLLVGNLVAYVWARRAFHRHIIRDSSSSGQLGRDAPQRDARDSLVPHSPATGLALADLRNWVRDPMLALATLGPLVLALICRLTIPAITDLTEPVIELSSYYPVIVGSMAVFGPTIYGFVVGMFVLEDREQGVLTAYRTTPLSARGYLLYRGGTAYVLSLTATLPAIIAMGLIPLSPAVLVGTVLVSALGGSVITLAFGTLASNTIEGLAFSKLINVIALGPVAVVVAVSEPLQFIVGVVPTYWPLKAFVAGTTGDPAWLLYLLIGASVHLLALALLRQRFDQLSD